MFSQVPDVLVPGQYCCMLALAPGKAETEKNLSGNCSDNDIGIDNYEDRDTVIGKRQGQVTSNCDDDMAMSRPSSPSTQNTPHTPRTLWPEVMGICAWN